MQNIVAIQNRSERSHQEKDLYSSAETILLGLIWETTAVQPIPSAAEHLLEEDKQVYLRMPL